MKTLFHEKGKLFPGKRAMFFTIDALISLLAVVIILSIMMYVYSQTRSSVAPVLYGVKYTDQLHNSLVVGDVLEDGLDGSLGVVAFLNTSVPTSWCASTTIFNASGVVDSSINKTGCTLSNETPYVWTSWKAFSDGENLYYSSLVVWHE